MTKLYDSLFGIPWYHPELYAAARLRLADAVLLPESYNVWLEGAHEREEKARRAPAAPMRVYVDGDELLAFCADKGLVVDRASAQRYAQAFCARFKANQTSYAAPWFRHGAKRK